MAYDILFFCEPRQFLFTPVQKFVQLQTINNYVNVPFGRNSSPVEHIYIPTNLLYLPLDFACKMLFQLYVGWTKTRAMFIIGFSVVVVQILGVQKMAHIFHSMCVYVHF